MKITNVELSIAENISMDDGTFYRRYPSGAWDILLEDSWESCWEEEEELEELYKEYKGTPDDTRIE
jgi:hypothetical protein